MSFSLPSSSFPPELADPIAQLRAELVEINSSEQACMIDAVVSASQGQRLPVVQAVMAKCRQAAAAAAATAIGTFRRACSELGAQANSLAKAVIVAAADKIVSDFWVRSESYAAAFASEKAALLPARGPDKITQEITNTYRDRASSINRYFDELTA
jgi:hypothetical protein